MTTTGTPTKPQHQWGRRGRHRRPRPHPRPRPRKALLAVGGLALAAGALSLVRLLPEPGGAVGGLDAGAGPRVDGGGRDAARDRATSPAGEGTGGPSGASPAATSAMGGLSGSPRPGLIPGLAPGPSASGPSNPLPAATTVPDSANTPDGRRAEETEGKGGSGDRAPAPHTAQPSRSEQPVPHPAPHPATSPPRDRSTPPTSVPAPEPDDPGLCVPIIGLCVDLLDG
ncbi:hypothetical protein [Streptomyces sp. NPDC048392]|uniref:hypothetical protein n=1 Tax=Streptomyces sp. NPDC048392 TaxID=3365543 RepID=UPI003718AAB3